MRNLKNFSFGASWLALCGLIFILPSHAATSVARLIVPGVSIGHLRLGRNGSAQLNTMAKPTALDAGMSQTRQVWLSKKTHNTLFLHTVSNGVLDVVPHNGVTIDEIRVTSPFFRTRAGITTGATLARIKQAFPGVKRLPKSSVAGNTVIYNDARHGIAFEFTRDKASARCIGITTYIAGRGNDAGQPISRDQVMRILDNK